MSRWLKPLLAASDFAAALARVREFKQREMLRIAARDLARLGNLPEIMQEISDVADVCLERCGRCATGSSPARYGQPCHQDAGGRWQPTAGCVLGMGKLGGQELNYSSDVDVLFVYSEEGGVFKEPSRDRRDVPPGADQPPVLQPAGRGVHRRGEPHDARRDAVPRSICACGPKAMPAR